MYLYVFIIHILLLGAAKTKYLHKNIRNQIESTLFQIFPSKLLAEDTNLISRGLDLSVTGNVQHSGPDLKYLNNHSNLCKHSRSPEVESY